mmetsp:Transcript_20433/g.47292  ORF Transcript_20433/g.47292 Transcript_20433/m.47292 type:complete len:253 (+) Transcript_20433:38-796(+)
MTTAVLFLLVLLVGSVRAFVSLNLRQQVSTCTVLFQEQDALRRARLLREEAAKIRREIASYEEQKDEAEKRERMEQVKQQRKVQEARQMAQEVRNRYSAVIPVLKGDGRTVMERVDFPPRHSNGSYITALEASLPMDLILGESEDMQGAIVVDEVLPGGSGEQAGIEVGDLLRACTACRTMMEAPAWQIMAGGIGMPRTRRFMYATDRRPFEEVMEAISSNRMDPEGRSVVLVLEKKKEEPKKAEKKEKVPP